MKKIAARNFHSFDFCNSQQCGACTMCKYTLCKSFIQFLTVSVDQHAKYIKTYGYEASTWYTDELSVNLRCGVHLSDVTILEGHVPQQSSKLASVHSRSAFSLFFSHQPDPTIPSVDCWVRLGPQTSTTNQLCLVRL